MVQEISKNKQNPTIKSLFCKNKNSIFAKTNCNYNIKIGQKRIYP